MDADEHDHRRRAEIVHAAQHASDRVGGDEAQAVVGLARSGHVRARERDAGDHLEDEDGERRAAEDVEPAFGPFAGHDVREDRAHGSRHARDVVEPAPRMPGATADPRVSGPRSGAG